MKTTKDYNVMKLLLVLCGILLVVFQGRAQCSPPKPVLDSPANYTICLDSERPTVNLHFNINGSGCAAGDLTLKLYQNDSYLRNIDFTPAYPGSDRMLATVDGHDYFVADRNTSVYKLYVFKNGGGSGQPAQFTVTNSPYQDDDFEISNGSIITGTTISHCSQDEAVIEVLQNQNVPGSFTWRGPDNAVLGFGEERTLDELEEGEYSITFNPASSGCTPGALVTHSFQVNLLDTPHPIVITPEEPVSVCNQNTTELQVDIGSNTITAASYEWRLHHSTTDPGTVIGDDAPWVEVPAISTTKYVSCRVSGLFGDCSYQQTRTTPLKAIVVTTGLNLSSSDFTKEEHCGYTRVSKQTNNLNWYWQSSADERSLSNNLPYYDFYTTGSIWVISNENGCWGDPYRIDVTVPTLNITPNKPTFRFDDGVYTLIKGTQNPTYDYFWQTSPTGVVLDGDEEYEVTSAGTYYLRAKRKDGGCWLGAVRIVLPDFNPTTLGDPITRLNTNRFTTYTYQTSSPVVDRDNALPEHVLVGNAYHDGLGRLIERVDKQASPSGKDLVMAYQYDALGRNAKQYLPFESTDNNGDPVAQPYMRQQTFYETTDGVAYSSLPFSLSDYESSPLDRIREYAPPGEEWAGTILSANARSIKTTYGANAAGEVIKWEIGSALPHRQYDYPVNELSKTVTIDEEGNKVIEFADKFGQVILKRVQANESADLWADTYYLYDVYGSLHYVLPPMATANLTEYLAGDDVQKQKFLDRWAFQYHYDTRRRLVKKRVPGADWVYMVYDQRDRLVLTQDGKQRLGDPASQ